jgi:hypothetical protein
MRGAKSGTSECRLKLGFGRSWRWGWSETGEVGVITGNDHTCKQRKI